MAINSAPKRATVAFMRLAILAMLFRLMIVYSMINLVAVGFKDKRTMNYLLGFVGSLATDGMKDNSHSDEWLGLRANQQRLNIIMPHLRDSK